MKHNFHWEILDKKRREVFKSLYAVFGKTVYLAGGTALALQIGHRKSFDFDLFQNKEISFALKRKTIKELSRYSIQTLVDTSDELSLTLGKNIKLTLLNYFWDPIFPLIKTADSVPLLSIKDIATTKAYALGRRGNYRDYFDLYVIIKNNFATLKDIAKWCDKKYGEVFSKRMFFEQLTYFGDIASEKSLMFLNEKYVSPQKMKSFFLEKIKKGEN